MARKYNYAAARLAAKRDELLDTYARQNLAPPHVASLLGCTPSEAAIDLAKVRGRITETTHV